MSRCRKVLSWLLILMVGSFFIGGCDSKKTNQSATTVIIAGSNSVQPISEVLAEEYMAAQNHVKLEVQGGGSSQGIKAIQESVADIGSLSRLLKDTEQNDAWNVIEIALDGVALVVHPSNTTVSSLSIQQARDIYSGSITNWSEMGGPDAQITVVSREEGSGTREAFTSIVMGNVAIEDDVVIQNANGAIRATVAGDPNAIGYISLSMINEEVKALEIDGVAPTIENVKNKSYVLQRPFLYVIKQDAPAAVQEFLAYVMSSEAQKIVEEEGAISVL